jgi:hypothetical protein
VYNETMYISAIIALATSEVTMLRAFYPLEASVSGVADYAYLQALPKENETLDLAWSETPLNCVVGEERQVCTMTLPSAAGQNYWQYQLRETPESIQIVAKDSPVNLDDVALAEFNEREASRSEQVYYSSVKQLPDEKSRFVSISWLQSSNYLYTAAADTIVVADASEEASNSVAITETQVATDAGQIAKDRIIVQTRNSDDGENWSVWGGGWQVFSSEDKEEIADQADKLQVTLPTAVTGTVRIVVNDEKVATLSAEMFNVAGAWFDLAEDEKKPAVITVQLESGEYRSDFAATYGKIDTPTCNSGDEKYCSTGLTLPIAAPGKYLQYRLVYGDNRDVWVESVGVNVEKIGGGSDWRGRLRGGKTFNGGVVRSYFW